MQTSGNANADASIHSAHSIQYITTYHNNGNFEPKVHWDERRDKEKHIFGQTHGGKADPVRQPLCIIAATIATVHALERHVGGIDKAGEIDQQLGASQQR